MRWTRCCCFALVALLAALVSTPVVFMFKALVRAGSDDRSQQATIASLRAALAEKDAEKKAENVAQMAQRNEKDAKLKKTLADRGMKVAVLLYGIFRHPDAALFWKSMLPPADIFFFRCVTALSSHRRCRRRIGLTTRPQYLHDNPAHLALARHIDRCEQCLSRRDAGDQVVDRGPRRLR